jgi:hypothetical protein
MKCEKCNKDHDGSYGSGRFCSNFCARSYSTKKDKNETKTVQCVDCKEIIEVGKRSNPKLCKCDNCKSINKKKVYKTCKVCGQAKPCKRPDICKK